MVVVLDSVQDCVQMVLVPEFGSAKWTCGYLLVYRTWRSGVGTHKRWYGSRWWQGLGRSVCRCWRL